MVHVYLKSRDVIRGNYWLKLGSLYHMLGNVGHCHCNNGGVSLNIDWRGWVRVMDLKWRCCFVNYMSNLLQTWTRCNCRIIGSCTKFGSWRGHGNLRPKVLYRFIFLTFGKNWKGCMAFLWLWRVKEEGEKT